MLLNNECACRITNVTKLDEIQILNRDITIYEKLNCVKNVFKNCRSI